MGRKLRIDHEGAWHHVYNRGIARRTMFESAADVRRFLALVADEVARGQIEVHAYCLMPNHFHLVLRSLLGHLSHVMHRVTGRNSRTFNRSRRRDGPLVRGRFGNTLIRGSVHLETAIRYVDQNPVGTLCDLPSQYPHGSAAAYRHGGGSEWLTRDVVAGIACDPQPWSGGPVPDYDSFVTAMPSATVQSIVEGFMRLRRYGVAAGPWPMDYDDLVRGASSREQAWMEFQARLADGTSAGAVVLAAATVRDILATCRRRAPRARAGRRSAPGSLWDTAEVGSLREFCGLTLAEVAALHGTSVAMTHRRHQTHRALTTGDARYRRLMASIARRAVDRDLPRARHRLALPVSVGGTVLGTRGSG